MATFGLQRLRSLGRILFSKNPPTGTFTSGGNFVVFPSRITPERAMRCAPVNTSVSQISSGIGEVEFRCPTNSRVDMVLRKPNEWQTSSELFEEIVEQMLLYGHSFVGAFPSVKSPLRYACYAPREIDLRIGANRSKIFVVRTTGERISPEQMIHFQDKPGTGYERPTRIESVASKIHLLIWADRMALANFKAGINANHALSFPQELSQDAFDRASDMLKEFKVDGGAGGGVLVVEKGGKIETLKGLTAQDVDLRATVNLNTIAVAAAFEMPPFMVGASDTDTKYSNTTARTQAMYRQTFSPKIRKITRTLSDATGEEVKAKDDVLQRGDFPQMVTNGVAMVTNGIMTANEVRESWFDLETIEGGDELRVSANPTNGEEDRRGEQPTDDGNPATPSE